MSLLKIARLLFVFIAVRRATRGILLYAEAFHDGFMLGPTTLDRLCQ